VQRYGGNNCDSHRDHHPDRDEPAEGENGEEEEGTGQTDTG
jgi:hypothetical protein